MRRLVRQWIPAFIAIFFALLVLLGYALPDALAFNYRGQRTALHHILIEWAVIVGAFAFLMGLVNILRVHYHKIRFAEEGRGYSIVFLLAALLTSLLVAAEMVSPSSPDGAQGASTWLFNYVISPVGASLAALVAFTLALAAFSLLRSRRDWRTVLIFIPTVILMLLSSTPLPGMEPVLSTARDWLVNVFGMAGMRGLLLGVVLGTTIAGLRALWPRAES